MQVKLVFTLLFFSTFCFSSANAQVWQSLNGPLESDIRDIVIKNDTVYVAAWNPGGVFKKGIHSSQWFYMEISEGEGPFKKGLEGPLSVELDNQGNYYAAGAGVVTIGDGQAYNHFFRSNDYGKTWFEFRDGIETNHTINDILISKEDNLIIGSVGGILSYNKEENKFENVGNAYSAYTFFQHKDTLLAGTIEGIEYSLDNGDSWNNIGTDTLRVYTITHSGSHFFIGTDQGLYHTKQFNQSWTLLEEFSQNPIHALYSFQDITIVGTDSGAFAFSTENDLNSEPIFPGLKNQQINSINGFEETIYIGSETGLYSCNLEQDNCQQDGVPNSRIRAINFQNEDTLWVGTAQNIHRYFLEKNEWDSLTIPIESARSIIPTGRDSLFTISNRYFLSCSFEHGSCDSTRFTGSGTTLFDLKQNTAGDLFLASREQVFKSTDKGENWNVIYTSSEKINFNLITFSDSLLFINSDKIRYNLATNTHDTLNRTVGLITQNGAIYSHGNGLHKSTDFGETWTTIFQNSDMINAGLDLWKALIYEEEEHKLYAITTEGRVYLTKDDGANWGVDTGMYPVYMESATIGHDGTIYLGTMRGGVFTNTESLNPPITISNEEEPASLGPKSFKLQQNYPNPFNPSTTIPFKLNHSSEVLISIYNIFGQKVRVYNLGQRNTGSHQYKVDLENQASGVYLLQIQAGKYSQVIKISLIK